MKDQGTYLMSNGIPAEPIGSNVTYAVGLGSDADWDAVRAVCGGDDFVEQLDGDDVEALLAHADATHARYLYIDVDGDSFIIGVTS